MPNAKQTSSASLSCTAFDHDQRIASGPYQGVALSLKSYERAHSDASVLVFDDATGAQIDFDLSGSDDDVKARLQQRFPPPAEAEAPRAPGRPKLGVVAREVTLLPRHWEWLAAQPGGASVTLRKLVEAARRSGSPDTARLRTLQERAYRFMSAMGGNLPQFEEASRALFANDMPRLKLLVGAWPQDVREHLLRLCRDDRSDAPAG
jgi:hypothetical protein